MNYDQAEQVERMGALYSVPCPCCNISLELVCYSSGLHKILPTQLTPAPAPAPAPVPVPSQTPASASNSIHNQSRNLAPAPISFHSSTLNRPIAHHGFTTAGPHLKSAIANFEKIRLPSEESLKFNHSHDSRKGNHQCRYGSKSKRNDTDRQLGSPTTQSRNNDHFGWGTEKVEWPTGSNVRADLKKGETRDKRTSEKVSLPTAESIWESTKCDQYKFDGGCRLLSNNESILDGLEVLDKRIERSRSCNEVDRENPETASKSSVSRCNSCLSDADLSGVTENSVESWYASFKKQSADCEWDRGFVIAFHKTSKNHFIGIELLTVRKGRLCIPLALSELNDLKKSFVYKFRFLQDEGFEVKPDIPQYSFLNELVVLPQNQISVVVPGLVSYSNYSLEEMRARKEKLHIWSDSVGFLNFSVDVIEYWNSKNNSSIFEPLSMVSLTLLSKWPRDCMTDDKASNPDWDVIKVEPLENSKMKRHLEACYPKEVFRFDDFKVIRRNDKKFSNVLESKSFPYLTVSAHPSQCLMDIDRVKIGEVLTAIVAPRFGSNEVVWQALIVGQIERIVSATNDNISFFAPKNNIPTKKVNSRIIEYVKNI